MEVYFFLIKKEHLFNSTFSTSRVNDATKTPNEKKTEEEVMNDYKVQVLILVYNRVQIYWTKRFTGFDQISTVLSTVPEKAVHCKAVLCMK